MNDGPTELAGMLAAARAAEADGAWERAAECYERCLNEAPAPEHASLLLSLGRCHRSMAEARAAWRFLMRAIALFREAGDGAGMADATLEALRIWAPPERQRQLAMDALALLGPDESRRHVYLLLHAQRFDEGRALAERRGYAEVLAEVAREQARDAFNRGDHAPYLAAAERLQEAFAAVGDHERAANTIRGAGYALLAAGRLADGEVLARRARDRAREHHLRFPEELAVLDVAGVAFARDDLDGCGAVLASLSTNLDFRADLYRMWIAEARGDVEGALALMPSPDRAGGAYGALSQVHGGRGGLLFRAGREDAARAELGAWADAADKDDRLLEDMPAIVECVVACASDELLRQIDAAGARYPRVRYSPLQGRGVDFARGRVALRLGRTDLARGHFETGLGWAQEQGCAPDAARCGAALAMLR